MKKYWLYIVIAAIIFLSYRIYRNRKNIKASSMPITEALLGIAINTSLGNGFPLRLKSSGSNVTKLQEHLNRIIDPQIYTPLKVDGIFGIRTEERLLLIHLKRIATEQDLIDWVKAETAIPVKKTVTKVFAKKQLVMRKESDGRAVVFSTNDYVGIMGSKDKNSIKVVHTEYPLFGNAISEILLLNTTDGLENSLDLRVEEVK
jgi:hypothetical protein